MVAAGVAFFSNANPRAVARDGACPCQRKDSPRR